jgi:hypothetical protein
VLTFRNFIFSCSSAFAGFNLEVALLKASFSLCLTNSWKGLRIWLVGKVSSSDNSASLPRSSVNLVVWFGIGELAVDSVKDWNRGILDSFHWSLDGMASHNHPGRCPLCEITDIRHVVQRQEALIADNMTSIFTATWKIMLRGEP